MIIWYEGRVEGYEGARGLVLWNGYSDEIGAMEENHGRFRVKEGQVDWMDTSYGRFFRG